MVGAPGCFSHNTEPKAPLPQFEPSPHLCARPLPSENLPHYGPSSRAVRPHLATSPASMSCLPLCASIWGISFLCSRPVMPWPCASWCGKKSGVGDGTGGCGACPLEIKKGWFRAARGLGSSSSGWRRRRRTSSHNAYSVGPYRRSSKTCLGGRPSLGRPAGRSGAFTHAAAC